MNFFFQFEYRNNFNNSNKSNSDSESSSSKSSSNTNDSTTNRSKSVTKSKISGTWNANDTLSASTANRNNENASVAAVTKSIFNNYSPMQHGNTLSSSTFSVPPKNANTDDNDDDDDNTSDDGGAMGFGNSKAAGLQPVNTINNGGGNGNSAGAYDDTNGLYCGPTTARNLFWNVTRVGDINVQPCPPGSTGIAKWRCSGTLLPSKTQKPSAFNHNSDNTNDNHIDDDPLYGNSIERGYMWQPSTPDLTQCRSLWLNSLEVRVNQRDSALVSIANDLSQVIFIN